MSRRIENIVILLFLGMLAFMIINNYSNIELALFGKNADPSANKPEYVIADIEKAIHSGINSERTKAGIGALAWDSNLSSIAREHSVDMAMRGFFDHINPDNEGPTERGIRHGYNCTRYFDSYVRTGIAENIHQNNLYTTYEYQGDSIISYNWSSVDQIAKKTVEDWMKSENHRKNILDPGFDGEGIGVYIDEKYKVWVTENFC